uniref:Si:busm1-57f23.1 n=1 Tax=Cyprinus carpio carpio TaxID=630221 RepID=A0A9J7X1M4_CYPCA
MDICFLLVLSFLSVFHFSSADQPLEEAIIVPRNVELLGGWTLANPKREDVQEAAKEAVEVFNKKSRAKRYFKLINVTSASTQVTNKINYKIEATIGKTKCRKSEDNDIQQLTCKIEVTLDPKTDDHEVQKISCRRSA